MIKNKFIYYILSLIIIIVLINSLIQQNKIFKNIEKYQEINANSIIYANAKRLINKNTINNTDLTNTIKNVNDIQKKINKQNTILGNLGVTDKLSEFKIDNNKDCIFKDVNYKIPGSTFDNYKCINGKNCHKACAEHCHNSDECYGFIVQKNNNKDIVGINDDDNTSCWCSNVCHSGNSSFKINSKNKYMYTKKSIKSLDGLANYRISGDTDCSHIKAIKKFKRSDLNKDGDNVKNNINECANRCNINSNCKSFNYDYSKGVNENVCNLYDTRCNFFTKKSKDGFTDGDLSILNTQYFQNSFIDGNLDLDLSKSTYGLTTKQIPGNLPKTMYISDKPILKQPKFIFKPGFKFSLKKKIKPFLK
jgi:hypothetical protein